MTGENLKNHPLTQLLHYLYLVPFLPALQPILVNFRPADTIIFLAGAFLVTFLVIYGNMRPLVHMDERGLSLFLHYRHNAEVHPWSGITGFTRLSSSRISIGFRSHQTVKLRLRKPDIDKLISRLEQEGINAGKD